jgi:PPOX class probable FMN-dependent enzyme
MDHALEASPTIDDDATLRSCYPPSSRLAQLKQLDHIDKHCRAFIERSPFLVIGSTRPGRGTDVSPRGDAPGFVRVLDEHTIAIPDRPGNNRLDTMSNIVGDAEVGLLFFIPGIDETLRVNGTARLTREPELLATAVVNGREPRLVILVAVREAFLHCGKALKRARLWHDDYRVERKSFPSLGRMIVEQTKPGEVTVEQAEAYIENNYVTGLY